MTNQISLDASIQTRHATVDQANVRRRKSPRSHIRAKSIILLRSEPRKKVWGDVLSVERKDIMHGSASKKRNS